LDGGHTFSRFLRLSLHAGRTYVKVMVQKVNLGMRRWARKFLIFRILIGFSSQYRYRISTGTPVKICVYITVSVYTCVHSCVCVHIPLYCTVVSREVHGVCVQLSLVLIRGYILNKNKARRPFKTGQVHCTHTMAPCMVHPGISREFTIVRFLGMLLGQHIPSNMCVFYRQILQTSQLNRRACDCLKLVKNSNVTQKLPDSGYWCSKKKHWTALTREESLLLYFSTHEKSRLFKFLCERRSKQLDRRAKIFL
jgi:hypothetical protein